MNKATLIAGATSGIVGLFAGGAIAASEAPDPEVVTETVTEEVEVVKEVEVPVEVVTIPDACLDALDSGAALVDALNDTTDFLSRALDVNQRAFIALGNMDMYALDAATFELENLTSDMNSAGNTHAGVIPNFEITAEACRNAQEGI